MAGDQMSKRERSLRMVELSLNAAVHVNEGNVVPPEFIIRDADEYLKWAMDAYDKAYDRFD